MQTYWVEPHSKSASTSQGSDEPPKEADSQLIDDGLKRLVDWNVEVLARSLKALVTHRQVAVASGKRAAIKPLDTKFEPHAGPLEEVKDVLELPGFDATIAKRIKSADSVCVGPRSPRRTQLLRHSHCQHVSHQSLP